MSNDSKSPAPGEQLTQAQINRIVKQQQSRASTGGIDRPALDKALAALPGDYDDPDYVVGAMRHHFGDLFTEDDEAHVRDTVPAKTKKPSDGLKVDELKAALEAKGVQYTADAKKADLQALYDATE